MPRRIAAIILIAAATLAAAATATSAPPPSVRAAAVLVSNGVSGERLHQTRVRQRLPIASITKLMTALVVLEHARPDDIVTVGGPAAKVGGSTVGLRSGERISVDDLLRALLVQSANDAALALAHHVGDGSVPKFVALMNAKARELGLTDTHFSRPDGLDAPRHYSSARDVLELARVAMSKPVIRKTVRIRTATIQGGRSLRSWNDLLFAYPGTIGVKTGHTDDAGWSEVAAVRRNGVTLYAVLLGGPTREQRNADLIELFEWGFDQYRRVDAVQPDRAYADVAIPYSDDRLRVVAPAAVPASVLVDHTLVERIVTPGLVELPVEKGERVGEVRIFDGDRLIASSPLVAAASVDAPTLAERIGWYAGRALDHAGDLFGGLFGLFG